MASLLPRLRGGHAHLAATPTRLVHSARNAGRKSRNSRLVLLNSFKKDRESFSVLLGLWGGSRIVGLYKGLLDLGDIGQIAPANLWLCPFG